MALGPASSASHNLHAWRPACFIGRRHPRGREQEIPGAIVQADAVPVTASVMVCAHPDAPTSPPLSKLPSACGLALGLSGRSQPTTSASLGPPCQGGWPRRESRSRVPTERMDSATPAILGAAHPPGRGLGRGGHCCPDRLRCPFGPRRQHSLPSGRTDVMSAASMSSTRLCETPRYRLPPRTKALRRPR